MTNFSSSIVDTSSQKITAIIRSNSNAFDARIEKANKTNSLETLKANYANRAFMTVALENNVEFDFININVKALARIHNTINYLTTESEKLSVYTSILFKGVVAYCNKANTREITTQHLLALMSSSETKESLELEQRTRFTTYSANTASSQVSMTKSMLVALKVATIKENAKNAILCIDFESDLIKSLMTKLNLELSVTND